MLLASSIFSLVLTLQMHFVLAGDWGCNIPPQGYHEISSLSTVHFGLAPLGFLLVYHPFINWLLSRRWDIAEFKRIIATMVLTGGTVYVNPSTYKYAVRYYGKDTILHRIFCALLMKVYGIEAKPARWKIKNSYITQVYSKELAKDLLTFSPTYICRNPGRDGKSHPSASFLLEARLETLKEALRLAASSTGSVGYTVEPEHNGGFTVRPFFTFGHLSPPSLLSDYQQVLMRVGLKTSMVLDWRFGRGFLRSRSWKTLEKLAEMGGFIPEVKVGFGVYRGVEKNLLLQVLLDFHQQNNSFTYKWDASKAVESSLNKMNFLKASSP